MQLLHILQLLVLMILANGTPIVAKKIFGPRFSFPLDAGTIFFDGRPLLCLLSRGSHLVTRCFARYALRKYGRGGEESCGTKCDDRCLHLSFPDTRAVPPSSN